jgi:rhodanese-related sulfurtransferase
MNDATSAESILPPIGSVPPAERMLRANWLSHLEHSPSGSPLVWPEFVARQGSSVRLIDVREADELVGPLGHIPGVDWIPQDQIPALVGRLGTDDLVVLISRAGERSAPLAKQLASQGMRYVASMVGGMVTWKYLGFQTSRDPAILARRDQLRTRSAPREAERPLSAGSVEAHLGDPSSLRWMRVAALALHGRQSCVDGRDETGVIGTPGGDSGELLLGLAALERVTGTKLSAVQVQALFERRLQTFGRFYLHGDIHAANALIDSMRTDHRLDAVIDSVRDSQAWRAFFTSPPAHVREAILEHMLDPKHVGCGHMRLAMLSPDVYGARRALVDTLMRCFYRARWNGAVETEYEVLAGSHQEGAVVNIRVEEPVRSFSMIPLVSPTANGNQMFVNHPQVSARQREELAHFLSLQSDVADVKREHTPVLIEAIGELADAQLSATLTRLAGGLPIYDVEFGRQGTFHVTARGHVPAAAP